MDYQRIMLIGNTAETTLGSLRSSIIAVKPEGFVSPIAVGVISGLGADGYCFALESLVGRSGR